MIMLTSFGQRGDAIRCRELGVAACLTKPVQQSELRETIMSVLARRPHPEIGGCSTLVTRHSLWESRPEHVPSVNQQLTILLAEDNAVNQKFALRMLERRGHKVRVAGNGLEALAALDKEQFDVVLMDVQMPDMDGLEATAVIRQKEKAQGSHIPIVAMTAHSMKGDRDRCLEAGMDGYISKPINAQKLLEALDHIFSIVPEASPQSHR